MMKLNFMRRKAALRAGLFVLAMMVLLGGSVSPAFAETPLALRWMTGRYEGHPTITPFGIPVHEQVSQSVKDLQDNVLIPNGWSRSPGYYDYYNFEGVVLFTRWNEAFNAQEELWISYWRHAKNWTTGAVSGWTLLYVTEDGAAATQNLYHQIANEVQEIGQEYGYWESFRHQRGLGDDGSYYTFKPAGVEGYDEDMEFCPGNGGVILTPRQWHAPVAQGPDGPGAIRTAPVYIGAPYDYQHGIVYHEEEDPLLQ